MRVRKRIDVDEDPSRFWPGSDVWNRAGAAFDELAQVDSGDFRTPRRGFEKAGIRRVEGGPSGVLRVVRMDPDWERLDFRDVDLWERP